MGDLILVLGGARGGKSAFAQQLAAQLGGQDVLFAATAEPLDDEMRARISNHQQQRPTGWRTVEAPRGVAAAITATAAGAKVVLVDCMTLLVSNVLMTLGEDPEPAAAQRAVDKEVEPLLQVVRDSEAMFIVVSNEVGMGVVPPYPLGRLYRDLLGRANQMLAASADRVYFMVAGLPMCLKPLPASPPAPAPRSGP